MTKKYSVTALGELLIDFTDNGLSGQGNTLFEANPGGAPCNVLSMLQKLGHTTAFIGKVGDDIFGHSLKKVLKEAGIETSGLKMDQEVRTTLAFVEKKANGDRDFSFYRNPGADMMLKVSEVSEELLRDTKLFHFGTLSMTHEGVREATKHAVAVAKESGALVSFDPNLRELLWTSLDEAKQQVKFGLSMCDILKISDNEVQWFTGKTDYGEAVADLYQAYPVPLILLSLGKDGSRAYYHGELLAEVPAFVQENTIETTGAGDTFMGCCLHYILEHGITDLSADGLREMLTFANAAASVITTRKGALRVMPTREEVERMISSAK